MANQKINANVEDNFSTDLLSWSRMSSEDVESSMGIQVRQDEMTFFEVQKALEICPIQLW